MIIIKIDFIMQFYFMAMVIAGLFLQSCGPVMPLGSAKSAQTSKHSGTISTDSVEAAGRRDYLDKKLSVQNNTLVADTELSEIYRQGDRRYLPKTTFLFDYPQSGRGFPPRVVLVAKLANAFMSKLPHALRAELEKYNIKQENLDIFINIQMLSSLGELEDHQGEPVSSHTTRLRAHTWVDPDAPASFPGLRLKRELWYGLFDPEIDPSWEVKTNELKRFDVHLHDSVLSPRNSGIKIDTTRTQSFWSLVIDDVDPTKPRANATFHILLNDADNITFGRAIPWKNLQSVGALMVDLKNNEQLQKIPAIQKLVNLLLE